MTVIGTRCDENDASFDRRSAFWRARLAELDGQETVLRDGGGADRQAKQRTAGKMTARERVAALCDPGAPFLELGLWAAHGMYAEYGGAPGAGVVVGVGSMHGREVVVVANDATVKAGAWFPMTCKKVLRAQEIALENRLPIVYLVDSAGVSCLSKTRSSPTATTSAAPSTTTPGFRPPGSSRWPRSWGRVWRGAPTCRS